MVQDLRAVNNTVVPIHPLVANPYILVQIPEDAKWFTARIPFFASQFIPHHNICLPLSGLTLTQAKCNDIPGQYCLRGFGTAHTCLLRP